MFSKTSPQSWLIEVDSYLANILPEYDSTVLNYKSTALTSLTQDFMIVANGKEAGKLHIAIAGVKGITDTGAVLNLTFEVKKEIQESSIQLQFTRAFINELTPQSLASLNLNFETLKVGIPKQFDLSQNYPNPFNPATITNYQLPKDVQVGLRIYNLLGQQICTLVDEQKQAGYHQIKWDGKDATGKEVTSSVYLYKIEAGDFRMTKKMMRMR